ncbi:cytochrome c4 [Burkholderia sp. FERM BP-3421]|jgi:cytochrome c553|uniref:c-type cytochrome n=1 Tax=Burkholderia sp. FERM BP-3421 TaxID=1494466 RepID=UPI002360AA22|nr:c-type cytochrome [Burkholderia sp. FERM BP-3421]WDD96546.1 cytochrome c4 [Burkholderia sp. FERM BP-3421]
MSTERLFSLRNRWFTVSVGLVLLAVVSSVLIGFVWLPSAQKDAQFQGLWNAICSAAGVPGAWLPSRPEPAVIKTSGVVVTPQMMAGADSLSIGRGATLAMRCTMCHGERGMSDANSPNLAGQYAAVVYKQLKDFQSGARTNAVMEPMVVNLSDQDMRDLAAYYAYLPRVATKPAANPPLIVASGAPMRNIAPCASCHGGMDNKVGGPWLEGEPEVYIAAQLQAFASGARHNDISEQMRNVARQMTFDEIAAAARYYAGHR